MSVACATNFMPLFTYHVGKNKPPTPSFIFAPFGGFFYSRMACKLYSEDNSPSLCWGMVRKTMPPIGVDMGDMKCMRGWVVYFFPHGMSVVGATNFMPLFTYVGSGCH